MSSHSKIEWTDRSWNPVTGCTKVSPACDHCYAERITNRFAGPGAFDTVRLRPERLEAPLRWRRPSLVFTNSMSDLFHEQVPDEYIARVFAVMHDAEEHTFQVLTKRHARARALLGSDRFQERVVGALAELRADWRHYANPHMRWPLPNLWLGVSAESQKWADTCIPALLDTPAAVRFVSAEPLLGPLDLTRLEVHGRRVDALRGDVSDPSDGTVYASAPASLDWVITGGESGPAARPAHPDWVRSLRDQAQAPARVPFFFKQWGEWAPIEGAGHSVLGYVTNDDRCQIVGTGGHLLGRPWLGWKAQDATRDAAAMRRYGKKHAGREMDGRVWDQLPDSRPGVEEART